MTSEENNTPSKLLEQASQLREEGIVIELANDRFQHFIGVKITLFLALAVKISEILNGNISCYRESANGKSDKYFNAFANAYCWESPSITTGGKDKCEGNSAADILTSPDTVTNILRALPYYLLMKGLLLAIPSGFWHYRVGGRLTGHLNFVKLLVTEAALIVKKLPNSIPYCGDRHKETAAQLDGRKRFKRNKNIRAVKGSLEEKDQSVIESEFGEDMAACKSISNPPSSKTDRDNDNLESDAVVSNPSSNSKTDQENKNSSYYNDSVDVIGPGKGKLLDRHLFSMLCYENFASFHDFLYFKSVCKATFFAHFEDEEGTFPLNQGILKQWCHKDNFSGRFLVIRYYIKHWTAIAISLATLRLSCYILEQLGSEIWRHDSFRCQVLNYEDWDVLCTLHRRSLLVAILILDLCISVLCLTIGIWQLLYVSTNRPRQSSCFFENLDDRGSVAMLAALRKRQDEQKKSR